MLNCFWFRSCKSCGLFLFLSFLTVGVHGQNLLDDVASLPGWVHPGWSRKISTIQLLIMHPQIHSESIRGYQKILANGGWKPELVLTECLLCNAVINFFTSLSAKGYRWAWNICLFKFPCMFGMPSHPKYMQQPDWIWWVYIWIPIAYPLCF